MRGKDLFHRNLRYLVSAADYPVRIVRHVRSIEATPEEHSRKARKGCSPFPGDRG